MSRCLLFLSTCAFVVCVQYAGGERRVIQVSTARAQQSNNNMDLNETGPTLITKHGYPVETHTVTTEDGYILTVHRIPGSPKAPSGGVKTPVFLQHGIVSSSEDWFINGPDRGLGFHLADQGYDVWMGNSRGNLYSRQHRSLNPKDREFWNFSWHEMGVFDLPACIDHILRATNHPQLLFLGYSLGANIFFVMTSTRPEYNDKIRLMFAMGPAVYVTPHTLNDIALRAGLSTGQAELFTRSPAVIEFLEHACGDGQLLQGICMNIFYTYFGKNPKALNTTLLPLYWSRIFSGASSLTLEHFVQNTEVDRFQKLDRSVRSQGIVSHTTLYDLSRATVPVVILYAKNDAIVYPQGPLRLARELPNVHEVIPLLDPKAGHRDFVFANNVRRVTNNAVIQVLNKYK